MHALDLKCEVKTISKKYAKIRLQGVVLTKTICKNVQIFRGKNMQTHIKQYGNCFGK